MVDANQCFTVAEAIRRARAYEPFDLAWFEEPLPAEDLGGHEELAAHTPIPIAVGESLYSPAHFREYLERGACSIVQVDAARIGGVTPWLKVAHLAEAFNVAVCPHFLMELHVSLSAAVPNARWVEYIPQLDDVTTSRLAIDDGHAVAAGDAGPRHRLGLAGARSARRRPCPHRRLTARRPTDSPESSMLTPASLVIRLHPNDDVVIARQQLVGGTLLVDENVKVAGLVPPGHKVAIAHVRAGEPVRRYNQIIGFASRDIAPGEHVHLNNLRDGSFDRDYAFGADAKPTEYVAHAGDVHGHRRAATGRSRQGRDAQLPRHPVDGELLGHRRARHRRRRSTPTRCAAFPNVDGVVALTHGSGCGMDSNGEGVEAPAAHAGGLRAAPELRRRAGRRAWAARPTRSARCWAPRAWPKGRCCARSTSRTPAARARPSSAAWR